MNKIGAISVFSAVLAMAGSAGASVVDVNTGMNHNGAGVGGSGSWTLNYAGPAEVLSSWGFKQTASVPPPGENIFVSSVTAKAAPGSTLNFGWKVLETSKSKTYVSQNYSTTNTAGVQYNLVGTANSATGDIPIPFYTHRGNGTTIQGNVYILTEQANNFQDLYPGADQAQYHQAGSKPTETELWEAQAGSPGCTPSCSNLFLTYGPFMTINQGAGDYVADYHFSLKNQPATNVKIATIDAFYRNAAGTDFILASRDLYKSDFPVAGTMYAFPILFTLPSPSPSGLQFRVRWTGVGLIRQGATRLYKKF